MQIARSRHFTKMRCWTHDDVSVKSFRSAFIVQLKSPASQLNIVRLRYNHSQQTGLKWAPDGKTALAGLFSALVSTLAQVTSYCLEQHRNFCLNVIKIWSVVLYSPARRSVWAARLPSDELMPPCPHELQLLSYDSYIFTVNTHTHTQTKKTPIHLTESNARYHLYIAYTYNCIDQKSHTGAQTH